MTQGCGGLVIVVVVFMRRVFLCVCTCVSFGSLVMAVVNALKLVTGTLSITSTILEAVKNPYTLNACADTDENENDDVPVNVIFDKERALPEVYTAFTCIDAPALIVSVGRGVICPVDEPERNS